MQVFVLYGGPSGIRTCNQRIMSLDIGDTLDHFVMFFK